MVSVVTPHAVDIARSMQYMGGRNGGLLVDFRPIQRYLEIAPGENHYERVRTVLDWIAFAAQLGLLARANWMRAFERRQDLAQFIEELRAYDLCVDQRHLNAFALLGVVAPGQPLGYAGLADAMDAALARRAAAYEDLRESRHGAAARSRKPPPITPVDPARLRE